MHIYVAYTNVCICLECLHVDMCVWNWTLILYMYLYMHVYMYLCVWTWSSLVALRSSLAHTDSILSLLVPAYMPIPLSPFCLSGYFIFF